MAVIGICALGVLAGCDDDEADVPSARSDYVAKANAVCADSGQQADAVYQRVIGDAEQTPELAQEFLTQAADVFAQALKKRSEIPAPKGDAAEVRQINAAGKEALADFRQAATSPSSAAAVMQGETPDPALEFDRLSGEFGLTECAGRD